MPTLKELNTALQIAGPRPVEAKVGRMSKAKKKRAEVDPKVSRLQYQLDRARKEQARDTQRYVQALGELKTARAENARLAQLLVRRESLLSRVMIDVEER